jgi:dUTP pyrophosphatase
MTVKIPTLLDEGARLPEYKTPGSAGADLRACLDEALWLKPMERRAIPTGLRIQLPKGFEAQVRPRSGLALEKGLTCLNSPGTIDADYRGEVKVLLINLGFEAVRIENGDSIAQLVVSPCVHGAFETTERIADSTRGEGGFGSTGM